ncbi:MAG: phosphomannomutase/phosphoglucomutase [Thalassobaculales bacterium]
MSAHRFHPSVLREYDIRGIVGQTLTEADARAVGRAFGTVVQAGGGRTVALCRDGRLSSPMLSEAVADGLRLAGCRVLDIGRGPTPMLYFAVHHLEADAGVMVTGSHNPPDYNGFKMMLGHGPYFAEGIQALGRIAAAGDYAAGPGRIETLKVMDAYADRLVEGIATDRMLKVAWDTGNGAAGPAVNEVCLRLPMHHVILNVEVDGTFPSHHPDPTVAENLVQLQEEVTSWGADLGIAFDGDGDRIGVVDGKGRMLYGDQLITIFAREVLRSHPGATIIGDVKASDTLYDAIAAAGGVPLMWKTGHSVLKQKLKEVGAPFAGEMSGHIFFADRWYGFDDAIYAGIRLIEMLSTGERSLAELRDSLPPAVNTPELRFDCPDDTKFAVVAAVKGWLAGQPGVTVNDLDGVRVRTADGWWLLRASNTQAVLVARAESQTADGLARLKDMLRDGLAAAGMTPPLLG